MYPSQFLTFYSFFSAAVIAYLKTQEDTNSFLDTRVVADAFNRAAERLSKDEQTELLLFVLRLIQQPEEFNQNNIYRETIESRLDKDIAKQFPKIVNTRRIIIESEFLSKARLTKDELSQKLRERRIFSIPEWIHKDPGEKYYPAFFVEPLYKQSSVEAVSVALRAYPGERKYRFFTTPLEGFKGKTPLEMLATGELETVIQAAKAYRRPTVKKSTRI